MNNQTTINLAQVVSFKVIGKEENNYYDWQNPRKVFGIVISDGYFKALWGDPIKIDEIIKDKRLIVDGTNIYFKPRINVDTSDNKTHCIYFETMEDLMKSDQYAELKSSSLYPYYPVITYKRDEIN